MKKKDTILLLGIISIFILIAAQVIIIRGIWRLNNEMLPLRYRILSQEAVGSLRGQRTTGIFDTVQFILNWYSDSVAKEIPKIKKDTLNLPAVRKEILRNFTKVLNDEQDFSAYLSNYFESQGFEKNFKHRIVVTNLEIIGEDTLNVYQEGNLRFRRMPGPGPGPAPAPGPIRGPITTSLKDTKSSILVNWFRYDRNYYSLGFDYFIDFSDKRRMILKEMSASLGMSVFSIVVVVVIFLITYRNLMEEKRLSNLKTDFINNMTHELKTPLSTITVAGKTLEMEQIRTNGEKILETAKLIGKQSIHLNQLINMILEISMWERTQFQLDKKKVDIEVIMNDIVDSFKSGYGNCASLTKKYNFNGAEADIDLIYFTTMINNLLSNAVKYSDKEPVINIEGSTEDRIICIKVSDNGIGINKADQKHIFDKFYRASSGNIHKYKGLGLGLYYVKKIAEAHGGDVNVSSKPGKGSIFTITIPY